MSHRRNRRDPSVMVVEDDPESLEVVAALLREDGYEVVAARGAREALAALDRGQRPDLILLDLAMPGMSGWDFLEERKARPAAARVPVLLLTGSEEVHERGAELEEARVVCCLDKPLEADALLAAVRRHLEADPDPPAARPATRAGRRRGDPRNREDDLLAILSHELKSPLGAVSMLASRLLARAAPASSERRDLEAILASTRRMAALLRDLRDLAEMQAGTLALEPDRHRLALLVERAIAQVRPLAEEKQLSLEGSDVDADLEVRCDGERTLQVLQNLLDNAVKFTPGGGRITVAVESLGDLARIAVHDTGPGVPRQDLQRILMPYVRGGSAGEAGDGMGLGLHIAKKLVEAQDGSLGIDSVPGQGATFWFTLPLAPRDRPSARRFTPLILIIDDDGAFRREIEEVLEEAGYQVASVADGRSAWRFLAENPTPALILLDIMLPELDGWQLNAALRSHPRLSAVPTVVVSGLNRSQIEPSVLGVQAFLEKPFRRHDILGIARRYAGPARSAEE